MAAIELKRLSHGVHAVGGVSGLHLQVSECDGRSWLLCTTVGSKRREIGLGAYPEVGLASAHQKAGHVKELIRSGVDPIKMRKFARAELLSAQTRSLLFSNTLDLFTPVKMVACQMANIAINGGTALTDLPSPPLAL